MPADVIPARRRTSGFPSVFCWVSAVDRTGRENTVGCRGKQSQPETSCIRVLRLLHFTVCFKIVCFKTGDDISGSEVPVPCKQSSSPDCWLLR